MCPGLYADYILKVPRHHEVSCEESVIGENCKDLDLSQLKAVHFIGKVSFRKENKIDNIKKGRRTDPKKRLLSEEATQPRRYNFL